MYFVLIMSYQLCKDFGLHGCLENIKSILSVAIESVFACFPVDYCPDILRINSFTVQILLFIRIHREKVTNLPVDNMRAPRNPRPRLGFLQLL
jgi:hypothetical protein